MNQGLRAVQALRRRTGPEAARVPRGRAAAAAFLAVLLGLGWLGGLPAGLGCRPELAAGGPSGSQGAAAPGGQGAGAGGAGGTGGAGSGGGAGFGTSAGAGAGGAGTGGGAGQGESGSQGAAAATAVCPLCGERVPVSSLLHRPIAVSVDNLDAARPQSGLGDACLVYEVLAEGGITRFVAFFLHKDTASIGPVRSLRPYFLDLAMPLGAPVAHVGGSPQALADAAALAPRAMSIDEMKQESAFWRSSSRKAPHNCYTSLSALRSASISLGYEGRTLTTTTPAAFVFAPAADKVALPADSQALSRFSVTYAGGSGGYVVTYDYDSDSEQWMRYIGGSAHVDAATGKQLRATSVIVQYVPSRVIPGDTEGRLELDLTGTGQAMVFTLGKTFKVQWSKAGRDRPISYTDSAGDPLTLPPGPVWVLVVPPGSRLDTE